jgi:hypothetical protein
MRKYFISIRGTITPKTANSVGMSFAEIGSFVHC